MFKINPTKKKTTTITKEIKSFKGGSNKLLDEASVAPDEAVTALNLVQVQQGLWKPRWGTAYYGKALASTCDGAAEYVKSDLTTELVAISGGKAYKSTDGGTWTEITGATFTTGVQCHFMQIAGYLYIANGTDVLARYDGSVLTTYSALAAPTGLSATRASGLSSGTITYYAEVTALNEVGETVGSSEVSITVNKARDLWTSTTDGITWSWTPVATAKRYQLYISDTTGYEALLDSTASSSYLDNGTVAINTYVTPPLQNTTTAPKFKSMVISGNRIWATNNPDAPYTVYFSGTGTFMGNFSDFYGGGWINLEKGGRETPQKVVHYQTGTGTGVATVLCKTPEGRGAIWQINIESLTVGSGTASTTFSVPSAIKVVGSWGTEAPLSVVSDGNNIQFANRKGWFGLGPQANYYGILRTNELSSKIRPYWRSLMQSKISGICAYFYDAKLIISVPTITSGNNRMVIFDTERGNWTVDWSIGAKQFFEYTDTTGKTHLLYTPLSGTQLIELSENIAGDLGEAFMTDYQSGRMPIDKLWKDFAKLNKVYIKLGSPRGAINFEVSGTERTQGFKTQASKTISPQGSLTGMGWDLMGSFLMGSTSGTPTTFADSSDPRFVKIRKKIRDVKLRVYTNSIDADYILQGFILEAQPTYTKSPSSWEL